MKKICILATGGTIACSDAGEGLRPHYTVEDLLKYVPYITEKCEVVGKTVMNIDSSNMTPECWVNIAQAIYDDYDNYDGFVITHGTDTMAYTSSALTYMLQGLNKPVVMTGSQYSVEDAKTDAIQNLNDAILCALEDIAGIFVVFDGKLINGTRAMKMKTRSYDAFESVNFPNVAHIKHNRISYDKSVSEIFRKGADRLEIKSRTTELELQATLEKNIIVIKLFPGMDPGIFDFIRDNKKGVIIESYGIGGIPFEILDLSSKVRELTDAGIAVVVTTQCLEEGVDFHVYEVGKKLPHGKMIYANDMNTEALVPKLMWALGMTEDLGVVKKLVETPISGDLHVEPTGFKIG